MTYKASNLVSILFSEWKSLPWISIILYSTVGPRLSGLAPLLPVLCNTVGPGLSGLASLLRVLCSYYICNLMELTTRSTSFTRVVSGLLYMHMRQDSSCSWTPGRCSGLVGVLVGVFWALVFSWVWGLLGGCLPSPVLPFLSTVLSVWRVPVFSPSPWGLMAGLPDLLAVGAVSI